MSESYFDEIHEHPDNRVYLAFMDRGKDESVSALIRAWYENGQITRWESEIVPPDATGRSDE